MQVRIPGFNLDIKKAWMIAGIIWTLIVAAVAGIGSYKIAMDGLDDTKTKVEKVSSMQDERAVKFDQAISGLQQQIVKVNDDVQRKLEATNTNLASLAGSTTILTTQVQQLNAILLSRGQTALTDYAQRQPVSYKTNKDDQNGYQN